MYIQIIGKRNKTNKYVPTCMNSFGFSITYICIPHIFLLLVVPECCFIVIFYRHFYDIFDVLHFFTFYICFYLSLFVQYYGLYTGSRVESPFSKPLSKLHV